MPVAITNKGEQNMSLSYSNYSRRRSARFATFITLFAAVWATAAPAQTAPYAIFQDSTLTASGNTITATRVPVVTTGTTTVYENVVIQFDVDSSGHFTIAPGYPQYVRSATPQISNFLPGTYIGPSTVLGGKTSIVVSGPSIGPNGTTEWSLTAPAGADPCTYPSSATWYVGSLATNPEAPRLTSAGITSTAYAYGVGGSQCSTDSNDWDQGSLLGFSQTGNAITISSYTYDKVYDQSTPRDQITYILVPPQ
jgi:hypothetical protein